MTVYSLPPVKPGVDSYRIQQEHVSEDSYHRQFANWTRDVVQQFNTEIETIKAKQIVSEARLEAILKAIQQDVEAIKDVAPNIMSTVSEMVINDMPEATDGNGR